MFPSYIVPANYMYSCLKMSLTSAKLEGIAEALSSMILFYCQCQVPTDRFTDERLLCKSTSNYLIYQVILHGTFTNTSSELFAALQNWISNENGSASLDVLGEPIYVVQLSNTTTANSTVNPPCNATTANCTANQLCNATTANCAANYDTTANCTGRDDIDLQLIIIIATSVAGGILLGVVTVIFCVCCCCCCTKKCASPKAV